MGYNLVALEKGVQILKAFSVNDNELTAQAIAKKLNIPLSTIYKYLEVLLKHKLLERNRKSATFFLSINIMKMGRVASSRISLIDIAKPSMNELAKLSGQTVFLCVISDLEALCLETIESTKGLRLGKQQGSSYPLHAGAASTALLAYQDNSFVDELIKQKGLPKITNKTVTNPNKLKQKLIKIRENGYSLTVSELEPGAKAVGVPIFDYAEQVVASITIGGPVQTFNKKNLYRFINMTVEAARNISRELGYEKVIKPKKNKISSNFGERRAL
jgi:DNA-binding IclR family transcriptional regulator